MVMVALPGMSCNEDILASVLNVLSGVSDFDEI
jgi:hypothetical protein